MNTKLTLRMNHLLIQQAKLFAKMQGKSVSQIVGDYFSLLSLSVDKHKKITLPLTKELRGVLKNTEITEQDYKKFLEEKYR